MVRCKMVCTQKTDTFDQWATPTPSHNRSVVKLTAANGPLNKTWAKYTPSGSIELQIDNPAAMDQFKLGQAYMVDFTETPLAEADEPGGVAR